MHFVVGAHLLRHEPPPFAAPRASPPDGALVIVETRPSFFLPHVVSSAARTHPRWRLYVFGTRAVHALLESCCTNYDDVTCVELQGVGPTMTTEQYSEVLLSARFWETVQEEHVLLFQSDCVLVRGTPPAMLAYDFVGPVSGDLSDFTINGGLSLRRRSAMLRAVRLLEAEDPDLLGLPEDVAFCAIMQRHPGQFALPSMQECNAFAIETIGDPETAVGAHGVDKYYAPTALLAKLCASSCTST